MSSPYVYAPVNGQVTSCWDFGAPVTCPANWSACRTTNPIYNATGWYCGPAYCDQVCCHPSVTCSQPQDIGTGSSAPTIYFCADSVVKSIWIGYISNVCLPPCNYAPFTNGMNVYMYSGLGGTGTQLGVVSYYHVNNRAASGFHNTYTNIYSGHSNYVLGQVIDSSVYGNCPGCFEGSHVHWERCGNSVANGSISCGDTMLTDLSWVFRYSY